jgi:hypothetical protein
LLLVAVAAAVLGFLLAVAVAVAEPVAFYLVQVI